MSFGGKFYFVAFGILFLIFSTAITERTDADSPINDDALFLQQAANSVTWMSALGELAQKQAASGDVRQYGVKMTEDYRKHIKELNLLARQKNISLSPDNDAARRNTTHFFSQQFGADFDRNYISLMEDENSSLVSRYRQESEKGLNARIRVFASEKVTILEGYVAWAHRILMDLPKPVLK